MPLTTGTTLTSGTLTKGSTAFYRMSCWAKASAATTLYFKAFNGSTTDIDNFSISNDNQWQYYEKKVSASALPSNFSLKVTSAGNVTVDDIILMPAEARVSLQTVSPMVGVTSATDDRGNSVAFSYDVQGRKTGTFDRKRNLVQKAEYGNQKTPNTEIKGGFTSTATSYKVGTSITYTALDSCSQGVSPTYEWKIDTTTQSTSNQLTKTMTVPGRHNISLKVSKSGIGEVEYNQDICFELAGSPEITAEDNQSNAYQNGFTANCNTPTLTYTANNIPTGITGCTTSIVWRVVNYLWVTDHFEVNVLYSSNPGTSTTFQYAAASAVTVQALVQLDCTSGSDLSCLGGSNYFMIGFDINWETVNCN